MPTPSLGSFLSMALLPVAFSLSASCVDSAPLPMAGSPTATAAAGADASVDAIAPAASAPCTTPAPLPEGGTAASSGPYQWKNVTILGGGFVSGIEFSPAPGCDGAIYARTDVGGAYRWDGVAKRWAPITDWVGADQSNLTGIESIAPDPVDPNLVYVAAGQYLTAGAMSAKMLRSPDRGASWTQSSIPVPMGGNVDGRNMGERLAVDPNLTSTLFFGSRNNGLWTSTDSAATWNQVASFPASGDANQGLSFVYFDRRSAMPGAATRTIYVGVATTSATATTLYRTADGGSTWAAVPGEPMGMFPHHATIDEASGKLYFAYNNSYGPNNISAGAIWKLDTASDTWTDVSPPRGQGGFGGISADAERPGTLVVSTLDRWSPDEIYRTTNGGASWVALGSQAIRDVAGAQWLYWHSPAPSATGWMGDIAIDPHDSQRVLYETGQGIWWSEDVTSADVGAPTHWAFQDQGLEETVATALISPSGDGVDHLISGVGDLGGFRHDDLTVSPPDGMFSNPIFGSASGLDYAELSPSIVARVGTTGNNNMTHHGAFSSDGGKTWTPFATEPAGATSGTIAVSADGSAIVWAPGAMRNATAVPALSTDHGATWTACGGLPANARVAADRVNPKKFYATARSVVYSSSDGGATFAQAPATGLPAGGLGAPRPVFGLEGDLWITTPGAAFHSTDSAMTFSQASGIGGANALGFGMAPAGMAYPAVYVAGKVNGASGIYRSDDTGATWQRIDDPQHQYGFINCITGDPRIYGRVYVGSGGRGILYGDPAGASLPGNP